MLERRYGCTRWAVNPPRHAQAEFESQALHSPKERGVLVMHQVGRLKRKPSYRATSGCVAQQVERGPFKPVDASSTLAAPTQVLGH